VSAADEIVVGIVANAASGRDIRRLTTGASVFDNAEKGSMVARLMAGLGATGVPRVLMMPAGGGLAGTLIRRLESRRDSLPYPELELLPWRPTETARDTDRAVRELLERGVAAIAVLGGDGTHRVVARGCGSTPLLALSTGTNNTFPELREATVAGLALGLVATGRGGPLALRREKLLEVSVNGEPRDVALVDVAASYQRFVGARAVWQAGDISELVVAFASPSAVGLSSIAGLLDPVGRHAPYGLHVRLGDPETTPTRLVVPLAPGLVVPVGVEWHRRLEPGGVAALATGAGVIALDGEREVELRERDRVSVKLITGPLTIDVEQVMLHAAQLGALRGPITSPVIAKEAQ
jgi:predicted polyphosphate/ATP-dependent NAD kinase